MTTAHTINSAQRLLSKKHLHAYAQGLADRRAQHAFAFGFGRFHNPLAQRRFQTVRYGPEGFQTFGGEHRVFQLKLGDVACPDISRFHQPVKTGGAEHGVLGQLPVFVKDVSIADHLIDGEIHRYWKVFIEAGEDLANDFIKPLDIGDRHEASYA